MIFPESSCEWPSNGARHGSSQRTLPRRRTASNALEFEIRSIECSQTKVGREQALAHSPARPPARLPASAQPVPAPVPAACHTQIPPSTATCLTRTPGETVCTCRHGATSDRNAFLCYMDPRIRPGLYAHILPYSGYATGESWWRSHPAYGDPAPHPAPPSPRMQRSLAGLLSRVDMVLQESAEQW